MLPNDATTTLTQEGAACPENYWDDHITAFVQSGLSKMAYCRHNKVSYSQFLYRLRKRQQNTLAKVVCVSKQTSQPIAVIEVSSSIRINFYDADSLVKMMQRLS